MSETICHKFLETAKKQSNRTAVMVKRGGRWNEIDWIGYRNTVESIACGLLEIGVKSTDRVAVLSEPCFEWAALDLAILGVGAITVPIYQNSTLDDILFILNDCSARVLVVESSSVYRRIKEAIRDAASLEHLILIESKDRDATNSSPNTVSLPTVHSLEALQERGESALKHNPSLYERAVRNTDIDDLATIVYTSGTTGRPKGVKITHTQILSEVADAFPLLGVTFRDRSLSFLPYAHVLGRIEIWGHALIGYTMAFAEGIDRLRGNLIEIQPTIMVAVPRVFEKIYTGILNQAEVKPIQSRVFRWALEVGRHYSKVKMTKQPVPLELQIQYQLARRLVFDKITAGLGGRLRFAVCGGAPLSQTIAEFFHACGILILEGYGLTETTAAIAVNTPFDYRFGTVGKAVGDVKFKIADDGEILVHSKKVMTGYYHDDASTALALQDEWFHTGDIGELSAEGYLRITDRKKELIKTAGGKYVAPQRLEAFFKASRLISQVHIHGDQKKYIVALLTLNSEPIERFALENNISYQDRESLYQNPQVKDLVRKAVAEANSHLASYETIKNFAILPQEFSIERGEMTPSLKLKRKVVERNYATLLEGLYN